MASVASKSAVNRAGERLVAAHRASQELPIQSCETVTGWRERHCEPLVWLTTSIRGRVGIPVSYRLKRLPQIVAKLSRAGNMALARMQDIGGCRLIVSTREDADRALDGIVKRSSPWYEVVRVTDYRRDGRQQTGYRALHVIVNRSDVLLEVQIRTRRQHAWAEAVERAANRTGFGLKDGEGPEELVSYFRAASDCLAALDDHRRIDRRTLSNFLQGDRRLPMFFRALPSESSALSAPSFAMRPKVSASQRENNWLLVYNWAGGEPVRWMDCGYNCLEAARLYSKWEKDFPWRDGYEVVLIGSDSRDTIEWTHAHYFGRTADDLDPHGVFQELRAA